MKSRITYLVLTTLFFTVNAFGQELLDTAFARLGVQKFSVNNQQAFYDKSGRLIKLVYANTFIEEYTYDEKGKLKTLVYTTLHSKNGKNKTLTRLTYFYNGNGANTAINYKYSQIDKDSINEESWTETFSYDLKGFLIQSEISRASSRELKLYVNGNDSLPDTIKTFTNIVYRHRGSVEYGDTMRLERITVCAYDNKGNLISKVPFKTENSNPDIHWSSYDAEYFYEYDQNGNKLKVIERQV